MLRTQLPLVCMPCRGARARSRPTSGPASDRKSTRLNSSHVSISYAVFCLKKKESQSILIAYLNLSRSILCILTYCFFQNLIFLVILNLAVLENHRALYSYLLYNQGS